MIPSPTPPPPPRPPAAIGGFELVGLLGEGGMGRVYRARQPGLDRVVALKVLIPGALGDDAESVARFEREARAAGAIRHPNVVGVIAAGRCDRTGEAFIAFPLVEGEDLHTRLARQARLPEAAALAIARDVAAGLDAIHGARLLHRDLKPANILIDPEGTAHVADLGLCQWSERSARLTATGEVVGSPHYMAPEQAAGRRRLDARCDVYSLGMVLFRASTGHDAFPADAVVVALTRRLREDCPDPRAAVPELSEGFARLVAWLTARDPRDRCPSAAAARDEIERVIAGRPSPRLPPPGLGTRARPPGSAGPGPLAAVVVTAAVALVGAALVWGLGTRDAPTGASAAGAAATPPNGNDDPPEPIADEPPVEPVEPVETAPNEPSPPSVLTAIEPGASIQLQAAIARVAVVAASSDGQAERVITLCLDGGLVVWDRGSPATRRRFVVDTPPSPTGGPKGLATIPGTGRVVVGNDSGWLRLVDVGDGTIEDALDVEATLRARGVLPDGVAAGPAAIVGLSCDASRGRLLVGLGRTLSLWDLAPGEVPFATPTRLVGLHPDEQTVITSTALSADGRWAISGDWSGDVFVWDLADPDAGPHDPVLAHDPPGGGDPTSVGICADGSAAIAVFSKSRGVRFDLAASPPRIEPLAWVGPARGIAVAPRGDVALVGYGQPIGRPATPEDLLFSWLALDVVTSAAATSPQPPEGLGHTKPINDLAWSADGELFVTGGFDARVRTWRAFWSPADAPDAEPDDRR